MAGWFEKGRPALFEALTKICDQIDRDITDDIQDAAGENDSTQLSRYQELYQNALSSVQTLQDENAALKAKVEDLTRQNAIVAQPEGELLGPDAFNRSFGASDTEEAIFTEVPSCTAPTSTAADDAPAKSELNKLRLRYKALADNFKTAKGALERRKMERNRWMSHAKSLEHLIRSAEAQHDIEILKGVKSGNKNRSNIPLEQTAQQPFNTPKPQNSTTTPIVANQPTEITANQPSSSSGVPESTQGSSEIATNDELPTLPRETSRHVAAYVKQEPSSDGPSVLFARPVKRRREDEQDEDKGAITPRIKPEPTEDSSPITIGAIHPATQESLDLDDVGQRTVTPRKRQGLESIPCYQPAPAINATPVPVYVRPDNPVAQSSRTTRISSALTPLSGNQQRLVRSGGDKPKQGPKLLKRKLGENIASLAEDGGGYGLTPTDASSTPVPAPNKGRLFRLLNTPAEDGSPTIRSPPKQPSRTRDYTADLSIPQRRELPFDATGRRTAPQLAPPSENHATPSRQRSPVRPFRGTTASTLRNKPMSELQLDDFKINPATNEGQDFAFSEVVRDKDERACLPGCVDMHCCGKQFRALALSQRPNPPLTSMQRQEEQKLLESYLGDYAYRLATMTKEERGDTWLQAKTQELADKYGKHRHRFSRMRSPPGFWDADFPSTQDLEADRAEAAKREKKMIAERYREAMRPCGRWLFRDE